MAWAQRDDNPTRGITLDFRPERAEAWQAGGDRSCEGCSELIAADAVVVFRARLYCSVRCALEDERARRVPGLYLG